MLIQCLMCSFLFVGDVPDPSFASNGTFTVNPGSKSEFRDVAILPDGKILLGGISFINGDYDFMVVRLNEDGSLDSSFGSNGIVTTHINGKDIINSIDVLPDGRILAVGQSGNSRCISVARYLANGQLDTSFRNGGAFFTTEGFYALNTHRMVLLPDNRFLVAGNRQVNGDSVIEAFVARFQVDGALDTSFGTEGTGLVYPDFGNEATDPWGLQVTPEGDILLAMHIGDSPNQDTLVARLNSGGALDTGFGVNGYTRVDQGADEYLLDIWQGWDGRIFTSGRSVQASSADGLVHCFTADGDLDLGFGSGGSMIQATQSFDFVLSLTGWGKQLWTCGMAGSSANAISQTMTLGKGTQDGDWDSSFGDGGILSMEIGSLQVLRRLRFDDQGRLLVVGVSEMNGVRYALAMRFVVNPIAAELPDWPDQNILVLAELVNLND